MPTHLVPRSLRSPLLIASLISLGGACSSGPDNQGGDIRWSSGGSGGSANHVAGAPGSHASGGDAGDAGAASGGASNSGTGSASGGATSSGGGGLVLGGNKAVAGGGGADDDEAGEKACKAESREGQRVPLDMYFLVDSSGSMAEDVQGGTKWEMVSSALVDFLNDPRNADLGSGIGYFPTSVPSSCSGNQSDCFCIPLINVCFVLSGGSCAVADYAQPAVPLVLPPNAAPVVSDIQSRDVGGGTPTRPALEGALQYLGDWAAQHPMRKPVLVLATDGDPTGCDDNTPESVADVAASALAGPHGIKTFVIGVGSSLVSLDLVARAGGTDEAFLVDTGGDVATAFADALEQIRGVAASCDFTIPEDPGSDVKINPEKINVRFTAKGASTSTLVAQTFESDPKNCGSEGGWYYDDPEDPTLIRLCDSTCQSLSGGSVDVEFGCDTIVQPPR